MARDITKPSISLSDVSFQIESFEIMAFLTNANLQNYQFVAYLNKLLNIKLRNNGFVRLNNKKQTFDSVIFTVIDEKELFYMLLDIRDNNLDKVLKGYDKLLLISGDYNKPEPVEILENNFHLLPETLLFKRFDFSNVTNDKNMNNLLKFLVGDKNNEGLLYQVEMHLKEQMYFGQGSNSIF